MCTVAVATRWCCAWALSLSLMIAVARAEDGLVPEACPPIMAEPAPADLVCPPWAPACGGHRQTYATVDVLFLQRDNVALNQPLVINADSGATVVGVSDMRFTTQPGVRGFYGQVNDEALSWEVGYLGVWNMFADAQATGAANLRGPDPLAAQITGFNDASFGRSTYSSSLNSAEANLFVRCCDGGFNSGAGRPWQRCCGYQHGSIDWLAGFRWAGLEESAGLAFAPAANATASTYGVRSTSNLFGAQVGARGRMEWDRWMLEGWAKTALAGSAMSQSQNQIIDAVSGDTVRLASSSFKGGVGFIGDLNGSLIYRLSDVWGLRLGYNMIWLSGVALAPNQFNFANTPVAPDGQASLGSTVLNGGSSVFLHGANLGLEARW